MLPCVGWASPASARNRVVFPAPLSPTMAWRRPAANSAVTPRNAAKRPNCLMTLVTAMIWEEASVTGVKEPEDYRSVHESNGDHTGWEESVLHGVARRRLRLGHVLGRLGGLRSVRRSSVLLWRIFRSALGLQLFGMEHAIVGEAAVGQGLRLILESVGRGLGAGVIDWQALILLDQHELHVRADALDRSRLHVAGYAQTFGVGSVAHFIQLCNRDVVALAVLHAGVGQVAEQQ